MTSEQHNKYVAYSFLGFAGLHMVIAVAMLLFFLIAGLSFDPQPGDEGPPAFVFGVFGIFFFIVYAIFTAPAAVAGWAILKKKEWARTAAIVASVVSAMSFPFGTAACVYALWFFLGDNWREAYETPPHTMRESLSSPLNIDEAKWSGISHTPEGEIIARPVQKPDWR